MSKLIIKRKKSVWGCGVQMNVVVDDTEKLVVGNNTTKEVELTKGEHVIKYKVWNRREKSVTINATDDKEYLLSFKYDPLWGGFKVGKDSVLD